MEELREIKKRSFVDEEKKPYGRSIRPPIEICGRNFDRPMYPLLLQLCYYCQKNSSKRDFFETNSGKWFLNIQLCPRCSEYNRASQEAGIRVLQRYAAQEVEEASTAKVINKD
jgi:hypothetical protein